MPRDGNGNYALPSGNPVVTGTTISSSVQNTTMSDVATALTGSVSRDGQSPMTANLPMGGNKLTGLSAGTTAGDSVRYEQLFSQGFEQDLASGATVDIGAQNTLFLRITGTTTITSFGSNYNGPRYLRFAGAVTITNSSTLVCPGGNSITTIAGDVLEVYPIASGSGWQVQHLISGNSLIAQRWTSYATDVNATFTASITTTVMTVTAVISGTIAVGQNVIGAASGTVISSFGTGAGGTGTYNVSVSQSLGSGTLTTNTSPNFTITPSVIQSSYATGQRFNVIFGSAGTTGSNTINVSGLGAKNLKQYDPSGAKQPATISGSIVSDVIYDGTDFVLVSPLTIPVSKIQSLSASVAGNILTVNYAGGVLDFRSPTLTTGAPISVTVPANSIAIPNGATLGTISTISARLIFLEAYNGGSPVLCVTKQGGGTRLDETNLISPTTISAAATSATVIYSASAVSANSPYRVIGFVDITEATAGTWATAPTQVQGTGGQALASLSSVGFGQTPQVVTRNSSTTYYNTTGQPFMLYRTLAQNSSGASVTSTLSLNGGTAFNFMSTPGGGGGVVTGACMIPADNSYLMSDSNNVPASTVTVEVR